MIGRTISHYHILEKLGEGGMGVVYKARDSRLDRFVAIKVLPAHVAHVPEARQRFEREAHTVSALNHPHICTLYDIGSEGDTDYMVMEYIEGETLASRLKKGPLPLDQALTYAIQISDALDKALRQRVVHRDIKPSNIMIAASGVKVLDFGLAKTMARFPGAVAAGEESTETQGATVTGAGSIVGTLRYMAPEQLEGKPADARTDIFAFGLVFFEMLTGRPTFEASSQAGIISAIMSAVPPLISSLQPLTPPALDVLARGCLEKDPDNRWQSAHDIMMQLKLIADSGFQAGATVPAHVAARHKTQKRLFLAATVLLALAVGGLAVWTGLLRKPVSEARPVRFTVAPPEGSTIASPSVSPDGRQLAFAAQDRAGKVHLWIRPLGSLSSQGLDGTEGAIRPFWAPDSQSIAFFAGGKLKRVSVSGGTPRTLCDAPASMGGTWSRDNVIVFAPSADGPLHRVSASGGLSTPVTVLDKTQEEIFHAWPQFLPDGKRFLYLARSGRSEKSGAYVQSLDSQERKLLLATEVRAAFAPPDHLLFLRAGALVAQNLDLKNLRFVAEPALVAEGVDFLGETALVIEGVNFERTSGAGAFSVSENGVLAYRLGSARNQQIVWYTRDGKRSVTALEPSLYTQIRLSPDEKRLAVERLMTNQYDLWLYDLSTGIFSRLTSSPVDERDPVWSPDSRRIVFVSGVQVGQSGGDIYELDVGSTTATLLYSGKQGNWLDDWTRDGQFLVASMAPDKRVFALPLAGERKPQMILSAPSARDAVRVSSDGRWIAYRSSESGQPEIYVAAFPSLTGKRQVSRDGGAQPEWRKDGKEIFYLSLDGKMMAVEVKAGSSIDTGQPRALFQTARTPQGNYDYYAVTADGQRFLILEPTATSGEINIVLNWPAALGSP